MLVPTVRHRNPRGGPLARIKAKGNMEGGRKM